jgi:hypothetical protein
MVIYESYPGRRPTNPVGEVDAVVERATRSPRIQRRAERELSLEAQWRGFGTASTISNFGWWYPSCALDDPQAIVDRPPL